MKIKSDVLIIGGGVVGSSIAYHLATKGCTSVAVIDSNADPVTTNELKLLKGSTARATGGFRCQFSTKTNIQLSLLSRQKLMKFKDETGIDPGFRQAGYLFIATDEIEMDALSELRKFQLVNGLTEVKMVSNDEITEINPFLIPGELITGGVFSPADGYIKPLNILKGYRLAAEKLGVKFYYNTECIDFLFSNESKSAVSEVIASRNNFAAESFVNAAGAWAGVIANKAGLNIPVLPQRREIAVLNEKNILSEEIPMTIFIHDGFHFRQRDGNVMLLHPELYESNDFNFSLDEKWISKVKSAADERIKGVAQASVNMEESWAGLYEMSSDKHAILGIHPMISNFYLANGSSGHGVMHSPAIGEILSELIINKSFNDFDISPLRATRFEENDLNVSSEYL